MKMHPPQRDKLCCFALFADIVSGTKDISIIGSLYGITR